MKTHCGYVVVLAAALVAGGCVSPGGQPDYTGSGALFGGATGAMLGGTRGHVGEGALLGAVAGGLFGHAMDAAQQERLRAEAPQTWQRVEQGQPLQVADVKALAKAGVGDDIIISQIHNSRTVYRLATAEIIDLKNAGVSDRVIDFMINTPASVETAPSATVAGSAPAVTTVEPMVVAPGPGYVWIAPAWAWDGWRWVWVGGHWAVPPHPRAYWVPGGWGRYHERAWRPGHWR